MKKLKQFLNSKYSTVLFFALYFLLGCFIFRDYGLSWDEPISRKNGVLVYEYVFQGSEKLLSYTDRYYGTAFEVPLYILEKISSLKTPEDIFFLRHFITFVLFFSGVISFYFLNKLLFAKKWIAYLGVGMLIISPRIFADSFYNTKDIAFLSVFLIAMYFIVKLIQERKNSQVILASFFSAIATDIRIVGILLPGIVLLYFLSFWSLKKVPIKVLLEYIVLTGGFIYIFWPILWLNPFYHFSNAVLFMGSFSQLQDKTLYFGEFIKATEVPWHYLPVWIVITTPVSYVILFILGLLRFILRPSRLFAVVVFWFFVPVILTYITRPALYDGWRQFYFIYPALIILSLLGIQGLIQAVRNNILRAIVFFLLFINIFFVSVFMIKNHPYQNLYFSEIIGGVKGAENIFELDYWGLSFKEGLEYLAQEDKRELIPVFFAFGIKAQVDFLPEDSRRFVPVVKPEQADYILSNFRWQPVAPELPEVYSVLVDGVKIMGVYRVRY